VHADKAVDLATEHLWAAAWLSRAHSKADRAVLAFVRDTHRIDMEAATFDEANQALERAFGMIDVERDGGHYGSPCSISELLLPGGTSGQTLSLASIRTCARQGPVAASKRSIPGLTSLRLLIRKASMPNA